MNPSTIMNPSTDPFPGSEEEKTAPSRAPQTFATGRRQSSGWLQEIQTSRKFSLPSGTLNSPGMGDQTTEARSGNAFPWNNNIFTSSTSQSTRLKDSLPSPTAAKTFGSRIHQDTEDDSEVPTRKNVRSMSYSLGEGEQDYSAHLHRARAAITHRTSRPSLLGEGLARLDEDYDRTTKLSRFSTDSSSFSQSSAYEPRTKRDAAQPLLLSLMRSRAASSSSPLGNHPQSSTPDGTRLPTLQDISAESALDESDDEPLPPFEPFNMTAMRGFGPRDRRASAGLPTSAAHGYTPHRYDSYQMSLAGPANENLGRRHSFAHLYPASTYNFAPPSVIYDEADEDEAISPHGNVPEEESREPFDPSGYFSGFGPAASALASSAISAAHPAPSGSEAAGGNRAPGQHYAIPPNFGRPNRQYHVVTFKCSRADIYYTWDNTGLEIRVGDLVIVEGDRGHDLGQVTHPNVNPDEARRLKAAALDEHFRWLVMFSGYSLAGSNDDTMLGALAKAKGYPNVKRENLTSMGGQQDQDTKPKMIKRLAQQYEIEALRDKEGAEAKAKRLGANKAVEHRLPMEILDAEFQADYQKLTYYYYAEHYVNFNPLVVDIFKQYKIRIWMSAVNPASVVNPNGHTQPPSAIGPGAIIPPKSHAPAPVGPGFGAMSYRQQEQNRGGRGGGFGYEDQSMAFQNQVPGYPQQGYGVVPFSGYLTQPYGRYPGYQGGYPAASRASPVPYGGYYPPQQYMPATSSGGVAYGGAPGGFQNGPGFGATSGGYGASSGNQGGSSEYQQAMLAAAMANLQFQPQSGTSQ